MTIKCIIVDDEPNAIRLLEDYVKKIPFLELQGTCLDSEQALGLLETKAVDLVFLDINLPGLSGIDLAHVIPKKIKIIFTTAYSEYAVNSYEHMAIDYLLKPVSFNRFLLAITKAREFFSQQHSRSNATATGASNKVFFIKSGTDIIKIDINDLKFIEASKEYVLLNTSKKKYIYYKRMKEIIENLSENFVRVHHSFIVNIHHVDKVEDNHIFIGETCIPVSKTYREEFHSLIKKFIV